MDFATYDETVSFLKSLSGGPGKESETSPTETATQLEAGRTSRRGGALEEAIAEYLRLREVGHAVDRAQFVAERPQLGPSLAAFFENLDRFEGFMPVVEESSVASPAPARVGDYEIIKEIAHGGMGVVYKARQTSLDRIVALKMVLGPVSAGEDDIQRFEREARIAAGLRHVGIVTIHEIGRHEGRPFFSMDYIDGSSLAEFVRRRQFSSERAAKCVRRIAEIIHYAHAQGVLHRDLKPHNILIDKAGRLHVADFGLARLSEGDNGMTATGQIMGTPSYMSPEQATGNLSKIGVSSDVYSLGAILYELLTGRPPFAAATTLETLRQVVDQDPVPLRRLNPAIDQDLETICLKCLQKEASNRYSSGQALAEDLTRHLRGQPVAARPISRIERALRRWRRDPWPASVAAAVVALATIFAVVVIRQGAGDSAPILNDELALPIPTTPLEIRRANYPGHMQLVEQYVRDGRGPLARKLLEQYVPRPGEEDLREFEWHYWWKRTHLGETIAHLAPHRIGRLVVSPDGKHLAAVAEDRVLVLDISGGGARVLWSSEDERAFLRVAFSPDGRQLIAVEEQSGSFVATRWDLPSGRVAATTELRDSPVGELRGPWRAAAVSPDASLLAAQMILPAQQSRREEWWVGVWDLRSGQLLKKLSQRELVQQVAFSPDGARLATGDQDGVIQVWTIADGKKVGTFKASDVPGRVTPITTLSYTRDGAAIVAGGSNGHVTAWYPNPNSHWFRVAHAGKVTALANGSTDLLVTAGQDSTITVLRRPGLASLEVEMKFPAVAKLAGAILTSDERNVLTWDGSGIIRKYALAEGQSFRNLVMTPQSVVIAPSFKRFAAVERGSGPKSYRVRIVDFNSSRQLAAFEVPGHVAPPSSQWLDDGRTIAIGLIGFEVWDAVEPRRLFSSPLIIRAVSPDGRYLALSPRYSDPGFAVTVVESRSGAKIAELPVTNLRGLSFVADSDELLICRSETPDGTAFSLARWGYKTKAGLQPAHKTLRVSTNSQWYFSPGGELAAAGASNGDLTLWDLRAQGKQHTLTGHGEHVDSVVFSPTLQTMASGSQDGTVKLWDTRTGQLKTTLEAARAGTFVQGFSPNGRMLATGRSSVWETADEMDRPHRKPQRVPVAASPEILRSAAEGKVALIDQSSGAESERATLRLEAETLSSSDVKQAWWTRQNMLTWRDHKWSGDAQVFIDSKLGGGMSFEFSIERAGRHRAVMFPTRAPDYGIVQASIDGVSIGPSFDAYGGSVVPAGRVELGTLELSEGAHDFQLTITGQNRSSTGSRFGIDAIEFEPLP